MNNGMIVFIMFGLRKGHTKTPFISGVKYALFGKCLHYYKTIIESVDSISRDERGFPLTQYITNGGISWVRYTITHFKQHHRVLQLISNRMSV